MICIDSDCIIDFLKGKKEVIDMIKNYDGELVTTEINKFEVLFGIYLKDKLNEAEENVVLSFFESIDILSFGKSYGKTAAKILTSLRKRGVTIDQNDCFTASIMIKNGCRDIITRNKKHFSSIKGINVIEPD